jgi:ABC-type transporter Mla MlaB component
MRLLAADLRCDWANWKLPMLKVIVLDNGTRKRLVVEGALTGPWVPELESLWEQLKQASSDRGIVVDLSGTTAIDTSGKAALMAMAAEGAELVAEGLYTAYVVKSLVAKGRNAPRRFGGSPNVDQGEEADGRNQSDGGLSGPSFEYR